MKCSSLLFLDTLGPEVENVLLCAVNRRMDDWVGLDKMDLTSVELPETLLDANGK